MKLDDIIKLKEPEKTARMKLLTLSWDKEYFESYIRSYLNLEIDCDSETREKDIKKCENELQKIEQKRQEIINKYAEYLI